MLYKTIFILFAIYIAGIEGQDREGWPGYMSYPEIKGWMKIHLEPADYDTARAKCKEEGAQLLNPYIREFKGNAINLLNASTTVENPILAVHSLAKVEHVSSQGFEKTSSDVIVYVKHRMLHCVVIKPEVMLFRTECENKLPYICYAKNSDAYSTYGRKVSDDPRDLDSPYVFELPYFNPNATNNDY